MNKPLKQSVIDKLESYSLSDAQLQKLESLAAKTAPVQDRRTPFYLLAATGALAAFLVAFFVTPLIMDHGDVRARIAMEVASNHIKLKPMEVETSSIEGIRDYFNKLDFMPVNSRLVNQSGLELLGGRYCSLQGITAAQLRVRMPGSDSVQTLYQTEYRKDVFRNIPILDEGSEPHHLYAKGIKVKIWVEKGLLFALTEPPDGNNR